MSEYRSDYPKRVAVHHKHIGIAEHRLFEIARLLCPDRWVLEVIPVPHKDRSVSYTAVVTNGDDNVTAEGKTIGAALAKMIHHLLNGSVFPLGGRNYGSYCIWDDDEDD